MLLTITCPTFLARTSCTAGGEARKASILPSGKRSIGWSDGSVTQRKSLAGSRPTRLVMIVRSGLSPAKSLGVVPTVLPFRSARERMSFSEDLKAPEMQAGQNLDRCAGIHPQYVGRRELPAEIHLTVCDHIGNNA